MNGCKLVFSEKACFNVVVKNCEVWGRHRFPCKSLLLSTTVLNNKVYHYKFYAVYVYGKINIYTLPAHFYMLR